MSFVVVPMSRCRSISLCLCINREGKCLGHASLTAFSCSWSARSRRVVFEVLIRKGSFLQKRFQCHCKLDRTYGQEHQALLVVEGWPRSQGCAPGAGVDILPPGWETCCPLPLLFRGSVATKQALSGALSASELAPVESWIESSLIKSRTDVG